MSEALNMMLNPDQRKRKGTYVSLFFTGWRPPHNVLTIVWGHPEEEGNVCHRFFLQSWAHKYLTFIFLYIEGPDSERKNNCDRKFLLFCSLINPPQITHSVIIIIDYSLGGEKRTKYWTSFHFISLSLIFLRPTLI